MEKNNTAAVLVGIAISAYYVMVFCFNVAAASDPSLLQDFCVAASHPDSAVFVNGKFCKDPKQLTMDDFLYKGFNETTEITNIQNAEATLLDVGKFPAINTLGVAIARVDFGPLGLNTPHWHQRGSEVFAVMKGQLYAGFVTSDNKLFGPILNEGDVIVFPQGLLHFQMNMKNSNALAIAAFGSQNPGRVDLPDSVFGSTPYVPDEVLKKAFQVGRVELDKLRSQFNHSSNDSGKSLWELVAEA